jgi:peptidoglycan/LPS O-acetylase OafA/YrhL/glycosyltransferase involved in cell wall biosynthesis
VKSNYTNLDLLRSFAVLSVVAAHLWHGCVDFHLCAYSATTNQLLHNLSFTGVMFFFVHTCLVLMLSLHRAPAEHRTRRFLIRRAFRIYPLCWAAIFIAFLTGLTDLPATTLRFFSFHDILVNLLLVQNIFRSAPSIIGPLWSLPWEVQMYLLLPLFYFVLRRYERWLPALPLWIGAAMLAFVVTHPGFPRSFHAAVFPPLFIGGMVAYQLLHRQYKSGASVRKLPAFLWPLFVLALFAAQGALVGWKSFESPWGALLNACICLALGLAIPAFNDLKARWIVWPAEKIAKYSYGIYLLHVPALLVIFRAFPSLPLAFKAPAFLFLTVLLAVTAYDAIENPLIQLGKRLTQPAQKKHLQVKGLQTVTAHERNHECGNVDYDPAGRPPLISVITPVYNAVRWLPETLSSVRAQSLGDWEHLLVDDGSTDGSRKLIEAAARRDSRIRLLRTERNGGPSAARNVAIRAARGRYLAFLDADDLWLPEKLARSVEWMSLHGYAFIYHDYRHLSHDGARVGALIKGPEVLDLKTLHTRRGTGGCLSMVLDREKIKEFEFPTNYKFLHEDFCAWMSLIRRGHLGHRLPADLGRYRLSPSSRSANKLNGAYNTWIIYREISRLPFLRAAYWWLQYAWNGFWLYRTARPR